MKPTLKAAVKRMGYAAYVARDPERFVRLAFKWLEYRREELYLEFVKGEGWRVGYGDCPAEMLELALARAVLTYRRESEPTPPEART